MFDDFLQGLWTASGKGDYNGAAIHKQTLTTVENPWFGVADKRTVTVVWAYLEYNSAWHDEIKDDWVKLEVDALSFKKFPHYSTLDTQLTAREINLLANLTAWSIQSNASLFEGLFTTLNEKAWPIDPDRGEPRFATPIQLRPTCSDGKAEVEVVAVLRSEGDVSAVPVKGCDWGKDGGMVGTSGYPRSGGANELGFDRVRRRVRGGPLGLIIGVIQDGLVREPRVGGYFGTMKDS
jgi:hypothetical protein